MHRAAARSRPKGGGDLSEEGYKIKVCALSLFTSQMYIIIKPTSKATWSIIHHQEFREKMYNPASIRSVPLQRQIGKSKARSSGISNVLVREAHAK